MASQQDSTEILLGTVHFDSAGKVLTPESEIILKRIANKLLAEPNLMIDVCGYIHNAGSLSANTVLSQKMADQVKDYLTINLGLSGERIQTLGLGGKDRIASNKTAEIRAENRSVEIVIRQPDAVLTWFENDVKVQPPALRPGWLDPVPDYYLYRGYKVTTGKKSRAHIIYPNEGTLKMDEDAMVVIRGLSLKRKEKPLVKNIELQDGSLRTMLKDESSQDDSITSAPAAVGELNSQGSKTLVDEKLEGLIVAYQGDTVVLAASEKTVIDKDDSVVVKQIINTDRPAGFGLGVIVGKPTGISLKSWISRKHAIDFKIGWSFPEKKIHVVGDYLSYFPEWIKKRSWYPYVGIGGRLKMKQEQEDWQFNLGIRLGIGIEYIYRQFGLFGELYPVMDLVPETNFDIEGGIGVRYYFKN